MTEPPVYPIDQAPPDWKEVGEQIAKWSEELAVHTEDSQVLTRTYLSRAHHEAARCIAGWMEESGMKVRRDAVGNVIGRYEGRLPDAPAILTGSHFDTVRNAGKFDGTLGILLPIAVIAILHRRGLRMNFALEVIGFAEEEGVRFKSTLLGSRALAGTFERAVLDSRDLGGETLQAVIDGAGLGFTHRDIAKAAYHPASVLGFLEVHIEQGPVLLNAATPVGVVTAIAGASRYVFDIFGEAGHAGTVPMNARRDAAMAACEMALWLEAYCRARPPLVGTVGQLDIPHGAANVVPGQAHFSIDVRSPDDRLRQAALAATLEAFAHIAAERNVTIKASATHEAESVPCSPRLQARLCEAIGRARLPVRTLPSGAGHDAMAMAKLTEVAMLFVRCGNGGISHNPLEKLDAADAGIAAEVFLYFLEDFEVSTKVSN